MARNSLLMNWTASPEARKFDYNFLEEEQTRTCKEYIK